jgi:transposase
MVIDAILFVNHTGVQWRNLDGKYPPWQTVYYHFARLRADGTWEKLLDTLVVMEREKEGREASPSLLAIDSQSVKTVQFVSEGVGVDGAKQVNGRKRTILVDKMGPPFAIKVTAGNVSDNQAGILAVDLLGEKVPRLVKIAADRGYKNAFGEHVGANYGWEVEIAQKPESARGFVPEENRWPVERGFSWLNFRRRLFKEVEKTILSAEAMLRIAFISFIINRL